MKKFRNLLLFLIMIGLGVGVVMMMKKNRKPVEHTPTAMDARPVEVLTLRRQPFAARVIAYGNVEPSVVLQMRAQVSGKVSYVHPDLKRGGSIPAGTVVVGIDPQDYETALAQSQADLAASQAQLAQLDQEEANLRNSLEVAEQNLNVALANLKNVQRQDAPVRRNQTHIQDTIKLTQQNLKLSQQNLAIAKKEQARLQSLGAKRLIPQSQIDTQQQQVLQVEQQVLQQQQTLVQLEQQLGQQDQSEAKQDQSVLQQQQQILQQQQQVTELQGQLNTFATRRATAEAQLKRVQQQVKGQKTTLGRTEVVLPFDGRISSVEIDKGSVVSVGGLLFEADNTNGIEVRAELPVSHLRSLFSGLANETIDLTAAGATELLHKLNLSAQVRLVGQMTEAPWPARVARLSESVDPVQRTIGIVVAVDKPYENVVLGQRSPLLKGTYVQVELLAPPVDELVIPRDAVHQGQVYVVNPHTQLELRPIEIRYQEGESVVISKGLQEGEQIVVNDLIPVIPGMPLAPQTAVPPVKMQADTTAPVQAEVQTQ